MGPDSFPRASQLLLSPPLTPPGGAIQGTRDRRPLLSLKTNIDPSATSSCLDSRISGGPEAEAGAGADAEACDPAPSAPLTPFTPGSALSGSTNFSLPLASPVRDSRAERTPDHRQPPFGHHQFGQFESRYYKQLQAQLEQQRRQLERQQQQLARQHQQLGQQMGYIRQQQSLLGRERARADAADAAVAQLERALGERDSELVSAQSRATVAEDSVAAARRREKARAGQLAVLERALDRIVRVRAVLAGEPAGRDDAYARADVGTTEDADNSRR